jgi:hypothetical protein
MNRFLKQKKIIIIYLVVGFAWIYFSDKILLFLISDIDYYNKIQDYKGFFYVLYHHERWDGKGYPAGLKNEEIPLISQMICVADSWDAMRSKRAYSEPLSKETALSEIRKNKGTQFAPEVVDVFLDMIGDEISEIDKDIDTKQLNLVR